MSSTAIIPKPDLSAARNDDWEAMTTRIKEAHHFFKQQTLVFTRHITFEELVENVIRYQDDDCKRHQEARHLMDHGCLTMHKVMKASKKSPIKKPSTEIVPKAQSVDNKERKSSVKKILSPVLAISSKSYNDRSPMSSVTTRADSSFSDLSSPRTRSSRDQRIPRPYRYHDYPILFCSPHGTIAVYLRKNCLVELTKNKTIRIECQGKFAAASNAHVNANAVLHPNCRVLQQDGKVQCLFGSQKLASFGPHGMLFNMKPSPTAYIMSSILLHGTTSIQANCIRLPAMDYDFTTNVFFHQSESGPLIVTECKKLLGESHYDIDEQDVLLVEINGVTIQQQQDGDLMVTSGSSVLKASPKFNTVSVKTHFIDISVQENDKAYVKRGTKRVHVSKSGMVITDGNGIMSMDSSGRIVSSN